mgnify:CR=1 FL=1
MNSAVYIEQWISNFDLKDISNVLDSDGQGFVLDQKKTSEPKKSDLNL